MKTNRIDAVLAQRKAENRKALITFVTAGDGGYDRTEQTVLEMLANGADIVELGVPFSDPIAEGPVIQRASARSLQGGTTLKGIFELVQKLRTQTDAPLLLMMYLNTIYCYGTERFFQQCSECGIDGVIVPDMPYEEKDEIQGAADAYGVHNISLVTPASEGRIEKIASEATGFLYCVAANGVTGVRSEYSTDFQNFFDQIYRYAKIPCAVGFGVSSPEAARKLSRYCDGVIVGSAIVRLFEDNGENTPTVAGAFTASLREAMDQGE